MFLFSVALPHVYFKGITSEFVMYSVTEGAGQRPLWVFFFFSHRENIFPQNICTLAVAATTSITMVAKSGSLA